MNCTTIRWPASVSGKFARLYIIPDTVRISEELLGRIEASVRGDTTHAGLATRARVQLLRNHPDSALCTLQEAERRTSDPNDLPALLYTAYRANVRAAVTARRRATSIGIFS